MIPHMPIHFVSFSEKKIPKESKRYIKRIQKDQKRLDRKAALKPSSDYPHDPLQVDLSVALQEGLGFQSHWPACKGLPCLVWRPGMQHDLLQVDLPVALQQGFGFQSHWPACKGLPCLVWRPGMQHDLLQVDLPVALQQGFGFQSHWLDCNGLPCLVWRPATQRKLIGM